MASLGICLYFLLYDIGHNIYDNVILYLYFMALVKEVFALKVRYYNAPPHN